MKNEAMILLITLISSQLKYCLLGCTGYIGEELISLLCKEENIQKLFVMYRNKSHFSEYLKNVIDKNQNIIELFQGDILNITEQIQNYIKQSDIVIFMCGNSKWGFIENKQTEQIALQVQQVCQLLIQEQRLIFISSMVAQMQEKLTIRNNLIYAQSKQKAEKIIQNSSKNYVIIRPGEVYSQYDVNKITSQNIIDYKNNLGFIVNGGVSITSRTNLCKTIVYSSKLPINDSRINQIYSIGGENLTIYEFCRLIQKLSGKGHIIIKIPPLLALIGSKITHLFNYEAAKYGRFNWFIDDIQRQKQNDLQYSEESAKEILLSVINSLDTNL